MTLSVDVQQDDSTPTTARFDVRTTRCDATRANVRVSGYVDEDGTAVLDGVIESHLRAGRRFLRLHLGGVRTLDSRAIELIASAHDRLLAIRGTMILTGVGAALEAELRRATPASPLFLIAPTAAEQL